MEPNQMMDNSTQAALDQAAALVVKMTAPPRDLLGAPTAAMKATANLGERIAAAIHAIKPVATQSQGAQAMPRRLSEAEVWRIAQRHSQGSAVGEYCHFNGEGLDAFAIDLMDTQHAALAANSEAPARPLGEYAPGQWWLVSLAALYGHGTVNADTRRAAKVACDFAALAFAQQADIDAAAASASPAGSHFVIYQHLAKLASGLGFRSVTEALRTLADMRAQPAGDPSIT